jgi:hypothetical protein
MAKACQRRSSSEHPIQRQPKGSGPPAAAKGCRIDDPKLRLFAARVAERGLNGGARN